MIEWSIAACRVSGSITVRHKYLYGLQIIVSCLGINACEDLCLFLTIQEDDKNTDVKERKKVNK